MLGQVCCDSNGKLNAQSVLLEAGPEQGGQQVPVDLSELKEYSLFPGQVSRRILPVLADQSTDWSALKVFFSVFIESNISSQFSTKNCIQLCNFYPLSAVYSVSVSD